MFKHTLYMYIKSAHARNFRIVWIDECIFIFCTCCRTMCYFRSNWGTENNFTLQWDVTKYNKFINFFSPRIQRGRIHYINQKVFKYESFCHLLTGSYEKPSDEYNVFYFHLMSYAGSCQHVFPVYTRSTQLCRNNVGLIFLTLWNVLNSFCVYILFYKIFLGKKLYQSKRINFTEFFDVTIPDALRLIGPLYKINGNAKNQGFKGGNMSI